jgi:hypothetical protein
MKTSAKPASPRPRAVTIHLWCVLLLGVVPPLAQAATYYLSPSGSGSTCSRAAPCRSFATGLGKLSPGDTLLLRGGTYAESIRSCCMPIPNGLSWTQAITIAGAPGETATLATIDFSTGANRRYLIFKDLTIDSTPQGNGGGAFYAGASNDHIRLDNVTG